MSEYFKQWSHGHSPAHLDEPVAQQSSNHARRPHPNHPGHRSHQPINRPEQMFLFSIAQLVLIDSVEVVGYRHDGLVTAGTFSFLFLISRNRGGAGGIMRERSVNHASLKKFVQNGHHPMVTEIVFKCPYDHRMTT